MTTEDAKYADLSLGKETQRQRDIKNRRGKGKMLRGWMRSSCAVREYVTANVKVAPVLGSIPASSYTVETEGQKMKQC